MPIPDPSDAQVREAIQDVLARPEYATQLDPELRARVLTWIARQLTRLLEALQALAGDSPALAYVLAAVGAVLSIGIVSLAVVALVRALRREPPGTLTIPPERDHAARAAERARQGAHLEAAHLYLLAALVWLADRRWIEPRPEYTNRALRALLVRAPLDARLRDDLVGLFSRTERARFRDGRADAELSGAWAATYARLVASARS